MIIDLFSTRKKLAEASGKDDVYVYTDFPAALRVQLQQLFSEAIGPTTDEVGHYEANNDEGWEFLRSALCREKGLHRLGIKADPGNVIEEFNHRLNRASVGYIFEGRQIIRIDSQLIHEEVVKPALKFLNRRGFEGPRSEFIQAFSHLKAGDHKDAVVWANKAFESTMKSICVLKGWDVLAGARASDLVKTLRSNGLFPSYLDNSFDQLTAILSSGLPQIRNNQGGHGDGPVPVETPGYVASFAIHLAAAKIVFLVEAAT